MLYCKDQEKQNKIYENQDLLQQHGVNALKTRAIQRHFN